MSRATSLLVPALGLAAVATLAATLIPQVVWRPWADPDRSWRTHLNLEAAVPEGYTRTAAAYVGGKDPLAAWGLNPAAVISPGQEGRALYIAYGCASCHGLRGQDGAVGPTLLGSSARRITIMARNGSAGMPAYQEADLPQEELEAIAAYIAFREPAPTETPVVATPTATPWPTPTPHPTATAIPSPTPILAPGVTPTPQPEATPTPTTTPTPSAEPPQTSSPGEIEAGKRLFLDVGCAMCHGAQAQGGKRAPALRGLTDDKIRKAVREGVRNPGSPYPVQMPPYTVGTLSDEELKQIIAYLRTLD